MSSTFYLSETLLRQLDRLLNDNIQVYADQLCPTNGMLSCPCGGTCSGDCTGSSTSGPCQCQGGCSGWATIG